MPPSLLLFGSVFLYRESTYIYLSGTSEVWYAAKILDKEHSADIKRLSGSRIRKNRNDFGKLKLFCFVELNTEPFKGRVAHLGETEHDTWSESPKVIEVELERDDLKLLREEIMRDGAPVPSALPKLIADIKLN